MRYVVSEFTRYTFRKFDKILQSVLPAPVNHLIQSKVKPYLLTLVGSPNKQKENPQEPISKKNDKKSEEPRIYEVVDSKDLD